MAATARNSVCAHYKLRYLSVTMKFPCFHIQLRCIWCVKLSPNYTHSVQGWCVLNCTLISKQKVHLWHPRLASAKAVQRCPRSLIYESEKLFLLHRTFLITSVSLTSILINKFLASTIMHWLCPPFNSWWQCFKKKTHILFHLISLSVAVNDR